jgi:E3 ubiquitin-protein ligase UBR4
LIINFQVKSVRNHTKAEKKKLAMAMRAKQLKAIGLQANEHGQVKADNSLLQQFVGLAEESGLCCSICREGYKYQPNKVLAIYTYTRPCPVEEFESVTSRKTMGYSTVTHFNLVHVDCHMAAVRLQRVRDE